MAPVNDSVIAIGDSTIYIRTNRNNIYWTEACGQFFDPNTGIGLYGPCRGFSIGNGLTGTVGTNAIAIGNNVIAGNIFAQNQPNAMVIGSGVPSAPLINGFPNSLAIGFNSNRATLFVSSSAGANTTGAVGIATAYIPQGYKLAVEGHVICEELVVRLRNDWPDYVFANNYNLLPLEERKAIVNKNKHLPGIKPAGEMCEEGIPVSETIKGITQNIEEHELYLYQLMDEIKQLKNEIERLKVEMNKQDK